MKILSTHSHNFGGLHVCIVIGQFDKYILEEKKTFTYMVSAAVVCHKVEKPSGGKKLRRSHVVGDPLEQLGVLCDQPGQEIKTVFQKLIHMQCRHANTGPDR